MSRRVAIGLLFAGLAYAETPPAADPETPAALRHWDAVHQRDRLNEQQYAEDETIFLRRGLMADRHQRRIILLAEAAGLTGSDPIEFFLIADTSGHDYETLAISYARPSDIHAALEFIGLPAGAPYHARLHRLYPKGEPVSLTFRWTDDETGDEHRWRVEDLIKDARTDAALPHDGLLFVGSQRFEFEGEPVYAADRFGPQSIASLYNEPTTVLDVSRLVSQGTAYGWLLPYPDRQPAYGQLLEVIIEPLLPAGQRRIADVQLSIQVTDQPAPSLRLLKRSEPLHEGDGLHHVLAALNRLVEENRIPFVELDIDPQTPLRELRDLFQLLRASEEEGLIHLEPPRPGEWYYRALLPDEQHRDPARRPTQALELRLQEEGAVLVKIEDQRARREDEFLPAITEWPVASPADLPALLADIDYWLKVLLIMAPADAVYADVLAWWQPVSEEYSTVFVFLP